LTEEQQGFMDALNAAEAMEVCADSSEDASADPAVVTCAATVTVEGVTDNCDPGDVLISDQGVWVLNDVNNAELARGEADLSALSADNPIVIEISYEVAGQESSDTTTPSETQTIECTGTVSGTSDNWSTSTDCPDGSFELYPIDDYWLWLLIIDRDVELARGDRGEIDLSTLSADNPIVVNISYEISPADEGDGESDEVTCSVSVDATNAIFDCAKQVETFFSVSYGEFDERLTGTGNTQFLVGAGATGYGVYACPVGGLEEPENCYLNSDNLWSEGNDRNRLLFIISSFSI
jgi:hypothetical protein